LTLEDFIFFLGMFIALYFGVMVGVIFYHLFEEKA
tara:strand:- start:168 stop:272 length:105 start_codon:yes stop_codon:yes gene_type:complete